MGETKRYKDKDGHIFSLTPERAKQLGGYTLLRGQGKDEEEEAAEAKAEAAPSETKARSAAPENKGR